jgi:hypothetical protein
LGGIRVLAKEKRKREKEKKQKKRKKKNPKPGRSRPKFSLRTPCEMLVTRKEKNMPSLIL